MRSTVFRNKIKIWFLQSALVVIFLWILFMPSMVKFQKGPNNIFTVVLNDVVVGTVESRDDAYKALRMARKAISTSTDELTLATANLAVKGDNVLWGEVESAATERCGLRNAVCALRPVGGAEHLCLYYTGEQVAEDTLRRKLAEVLAPYMIPTVYIHLDELPLNANMKIDRRALPDPENLLSMERAEPAKTAWPQGFPGPEKFFRGHRMLCLRPRNVG